MRHESTAGQGQKSKLLIAALYPSGAAKGECKGVRSIRSDRRHDHSGSDAYSYLGRIVENPFPYAL